MFIVLPVLLEIALTLGCFLGLHLLFRRGRPLVSALGSALLVPFILGLLGFLLLLSPNPHHFDGPGMGFAACVMLEIFAIPISIIASTIAFFAASPSARKFT